MLIKIRNDITIKTANALLDLSLFLHKKIIRIMEVNLPKDLSLLQMRTLALIKEKDNVNMSYLAKELLISKQQCTVLINALFDKGYINRFTNPINLREVLLYLTDKALNLINDFDNYMESMLCENFKNISIDDKKNLLLASSFIKNLLEENPIQY